ncbi:MAG TPA: G5 domain-containing protein [Firmicutes bacterium]|nr:G5 domain-containing protein [Bacillota bacterium]
MQTEQIARQRVFCRKRWLGKVFLTLLLGVAAFWLMTGVTQISSRVDVQEEGTDTVYTVYAVQMTPEEIIAKTGIPFGPNDRYTIEEEVSPGITMLHVYHSVDLYLTVDGKTVTLPVTGDMQKEKETEELPPADTAEGVRRTQVSLADALDANGILVGERDIVSLPLTEKVYHGMQVTIQRVSTQRTAVETEKSFDIEYKYTPLLAEGETQVLREGKTGLLTRYYEDTLVDGVLSDRVFLDATYEEPVNQIELLGVGPSSYIPSTLEAPEWLEFDENGIPLNYSKVLSGRAAAYSAYDGAKTASGRDAIPGHIAVNPEIIPYGTEMYIVSQDGSYVYGYAIAADTGTALMDGLIIADLYFNSYEESCQFGIKDIDIYILE